MTKDWRFINYRHKRNLLIFLRIWFVVLSLSLLKSKIASYLKSITTIPPKEFQYNFIRIPKKFPKNFQRIPKEFLEDFQRIPKQFWWNFPKNLKQLPNNFDRIPKEFPPKLQKIPQNSQKNTYKIPKNILIALIGRNPFRACFLYCYVCGTK